MTADDAKTPSRDIVDILGSIAGDAGRLLQQHGALLREELQGEVGDAARSVATTAAGAGLVALGGVLGSLMVVHGLNRATRLPLWGCYGLVGGLVATLGVGLVGSGTRRALDLELVPRETLAALRDDLRWIADQYRTRTS